MKYLSLLILIIPSICFAEIKYNHYQKDKIIVKVTAYTASVDECDDTPNITASNKRVKVGYIALSRDIEKDFGYIFGDEIEIERRGKKYIFIFEDRMHKRKTRQIDIFMLSKKSALKFGIQQAIMMINWGYNGNSKKNIKKNKW